MSMQTPQVFKKGMAEKVGETLDKAKDELKGPGTLEKAGAEVDNASKEIGNAVKNVFKK